MRNIVIDCLYLVKKRIYINFRTPSLRFVDKRVVAGTVPSIFLLDPGCLSLVITLIVSPKNLR